TTNRRDRSTLHASFFFSSRRRHTRFSRDWSSDVCSSDLISTRHHRSRWEQELLPSSIRSGLHNGRQLFFRILRIYKRKRYRKKLGTLYQLHRWQSSPYDKEKYFDPGAD